MAAPPSSPAPSDHISRPGADSNPHRFLAARVAGTYLVVGLLWVGLSDLLLAKSGELTSSGLLLAAGKGALFVLLSTGLIFWLCRREAHTAARAMGLLRAVVEGTTDVVFVKDRDGRYLLANPAAIEFLGRPVQDVLGRDDRELFDASGAERLMATDRAIMAGSGSATIEDTLTSAGVCRTYQSTKVPLRDTNGDVIGLIGIARDITEAKRAAQALRESEERFHELADAIPQIVWTAGPDEGVTYMNAWAASYSGRNTALLLEGAWGLDIHPDDRPAALASWTDTVTSGVLQDKELRIRRADGEYRWHICRQVPVKASDGRIVRWYGTCTDIEDLKQSERKEVRP